MNIRTIKTRIFQPNEDLIAFIHAYVPRLKNGSILVVTSKIVALSEGRTAAAKDKVKLIKRESDSAIKTKYVWLAIKDGVPMANAGIDDSNGNGQLILLPKDSFAAAARLRTKLRKVYKVKNLGVVVTDSRVMPLRAGVVGIALGYAGFRGIRDYRKRKDIFGRAFVYTKTDVADALATAAVLGMGEGDERRPLAVIESAGVEFTNRVNPEELHIRLEDDMYAPLFSKKRKR